MKKILVTFIFRFREKNNEKVVWVTDLLTLIFIVKFYIFFRKSGEGASNYPLPKIEHFMLRLWVLVLQKYVLKNCSGLGYV